MQSNIVAIGGGHGLSALLTALRPLPVALTAIVAVSDDGGSSGRLRQAYAMPAPGDIRACLLALAQSEGPLADLAHFRFGRIFGEELKGHSLGNLILAALTEQHNGDFAAAVAAAHTLWNVQGQVLPITATPLTLCAQTRQGQVLRGETTVGQAGAVETLWLEPKDAVPAPGVLEAIASADALLIGPGSLYTSVLPPLLVPGITAAIRRSQARKAYLCNLLEQTGETEGYTATDHVATLEAHVGIGLFTYVLINTRVPEIPAGPLFVPADAPALAKRGYQPVTGRYWEEEDTHHFAENRLRAFAQWLLSDEALPSTRRDFPQFVTLNQRVI